MVIEATQIPKNVVSSIPTLEFNGLFDGQVVYQLGVIGELKDQGVGKYQTLAKRYPAHLESDLATKVTATSERAISQQETPGLYQVLYQAEGGPRRRLTPDGPRHRLYDQGLGNEPDCHLGPINDWALLRPGLGQG
ncbi:hypothetical protein [Lactobacillus delbrueckii]|uniref:hypothetical protein n=1 Tax=Lactobacillus delbrueckii TaxID=1584 RepID=UPI001E5E73A8|nr:hypothetical protein [Lactobacillus delbrueckii]MCD5533602.1 hypothetical protein [Lactobacillus delbrueckii subsp. lactis]